MIRTMTGHMQWYHDQKSFMSLPKTDMTNYEYLKEFKARVKSMNDFDAFLLEKYLEREKMLQVYFPKEGKSNYVPVMFNPANLEVEFAFIIC